MKAYSKRIIALTLAFIMVLAIPFSTFAEENNSVKETLSESEVKTEEETKNSEEGKGSETSATDQGEATEANAPVEEEAQQLQTLQQAPKMLKSPHKAPAHDTTQGEIDAASANLSAAIDAANAYKASEDYTNAPAEISKTAFETALLHANNALPDLSKAEVGKADVDNANQVASELNTELSNIKAQINQAKESAELAEAKTLAKAKIETFQYLSDAEEIAAKNAVDTATDIQGVIDALDAADALNSSNQAKAKALEDAKKALKAKIDEANSVKATDKYKKASSLPKSYFDEKFSAAETVYGDASATLDQVNTALTDLTNAINGLDGVVVLPKLVISSESVNSSGIVSGYVKADGLAVKGATVTFYTNGGTAVASGTTDVNGYFSFYVGTEYYGYYDGYYGWYDGYYGYYDGYYDGYYNGHKVYYNSTDGYYYYNDANHKVYLNNYYWNGHNHGRCGNRGYLLASLTDYETSEKAYVTGTCSGDYYYYPSYKYEYNYSDYRVYPSNMTRTSSSVRGYLPNEKGKTVYVYSSDDWYGYDGYYGYNYRYGNSYLGSATVGSDGYFTIYFNRSVSSSENLYFYVNGYRGNYATEPTMTVATPGTKLVQGKAGAYAGILIKDANGYELGKTVADKDGNYTCYINRELVVGESLTVVASETNKYDSQATYKVVGDSLTGDTFSRVSYIKGYPDGSFKPQNNVTRAEAAQMFATLLNNGTSFGTSSTTKFSDANNGWYSAAINYVVGKDLIAGYADGTFKPNQNITRAEFAQMISGYIKAGFAGSSNFKDVKGHWASDAIDKVYGNKSVAGYPDGSFKPNQNITRAEAVTILNSVFNRYTTSESLENVSTGSLKTFTDVSSSFWGYYQILDASNYHTSQKLNDTTDEEVWK